MDLRLIKYFIVVAQELNFSRASTKLHIEQSPLSRAIRRLEAQYETRLFIRGGRQLKLTWPGEVLLKEALDILDHADLLKRNVHAAAQSYQENLKIAICDEINTIGLTSLLSEIRIKRPDLDIQIDEMNYLDALNALKNESCGICVAQTRYKAEALEVTPLWEKPLSVILPSDHILNSNKSISLRKILRYPVVLYGDSFFGHKLQLKSFITSHKIHLKKISYAKSFEAMLAMVAAGRGLGVCTNTWFQNCEASKVTVRTLSDKTKMSTYLIAIDNAVARQVKQIIISSVMRNHLKK